ncbi:FMN-binding negative transcriptional regulator [Arenimonas sp.]|uniref:FMN-binding negative transcriptional regulator n=1 Tax=Arenimonas sp. TaxID=1872635 RepID=UPI0039E672FA
MYTPRHFTGDDLKELDRLAREHPFATVITVAGGAPFVSQLPLLYQRRENEVLIRGHWSRANPQWRHDPRATVLLQGPQAYVSPSWYPDKESAARVPTWNYVVAELVGSLEIVEDEAGLASIVSDLSDRFEAEAGSDWRFEFEREDQRRQLRGIVGFLFRPERIDLKLKLSQNHPLANRIAVSDALASGDHNQRAIAERMREGLARTPEDEA